MKKLCDILDGISVLESVGSIDVPVSALQMDSRKVKSGDCFIAIKGTASDGHHFISTCIEQGAKAIVCENLPEEIIPHVSYIRVKDSSKALGVIANNFYDQPSSKMKVIGVTGTNGKTSVATLLFRLFRALGKNVGLLSTVQNQINEEIIQSTHTTPDAIALNALMKQMVDAGCEYCFMEVSSHAVDQNRIEGLKFAGGVLTNITHDHLDYHKTFENYLKAKKRFFDELPSTAFALTNADDRNGNVMLQNTKAAKRNYALKTPSDFKTKIIENSVAGLQLDIDNIEMHTRLIGEFNAYNLTAVYAVARLLDIEKLEALTILSSLTPPEGRFDQIISVNEKIAGIVDYAHTPDALKNVLQTIQAVRTGNERVITVVGCGGDRDATKRPIMAEIACKFSNQVILTSDNPRSEDPNEILKQMYAGVPVTDKRKVLTITDRREAIKTAVTLANNTDIILLAGKG
ncbi:MAG: UDP-N-acetylmuramoyl-L-alanyl-D-glutamate--2,6-diaminopimelate ligase, partial [Bacteroidetes bacterium]|nr:UDP-N-acetylmuramoyl-L-alanyl-D-glutamate--2,6-diaminopimelate ligase [Bacteroidota bacterium]